MIHPTDILEPELYERVRERQAPALRQHKARRRVELGRYLCLLFESRETVLGQIHEVARVEGRTSPTQIQREIDEYACLVPAPGLLTATLTIHSGAAELGTRLSAEILAGGGPVALEVGPWSCPCAPLRPGDGFPDAVHYVGFAVPDGLLAALRAPAPAWLRLRSSVDRHDLALPEVLREELVATLGRWASPGAASNSSGSRSIRPSPAAAGAIPA